MSAAASDRERLADLAAAAAGGVPGVAALASSPAAPSGVTATAGAAGGARYDLQLALVAELTDLAALADAVRAAVTRAAERAALGGRLGLVDVHVADVALPA